MRWKHTLRNYELMLTCKCAEYARGVCAYGMGASWLAREALTQSPAQHDASDTDAL